MNRCFWGVNSHAPNIVVLACAERGKPAESLIAMADGAVKKAFDRAVKSGQIVGKGNVETVEVDDDHRLIVVQVGSRKGVDPEKLRSAYGDACAYLRNHPLYGKTADIYAGSVSNGKRRFENDDIIDYANVGWGLRNQTITEGDSDEVEVDDNVGFWFANMLLVESSWQKAVEHSDHKVKAGRWGRHIGSLPGSECTPKILVKKAFELLGGLNNVEIAEIDRAHYDKHGFRLFLSVNKGSTEEPAGIRAKYNCGKEDAKTVVLSVKPVTYDSGGLSIKPNDGMYPMKGDKNGSLNGIMLFYYWASIGVDFNVILIVDATENMIAPDSTKPGDRIKARNGQTVEVYNTDAEGRLVLVDSNDDAVERTMTTTGLVFIVNIATLTGAAVEALGGDVAYFTNDEDDPLQSALFQALRKSGVGFWPCKVAREKVKALQSFIAHFLNTSKKSRDNGHGTAALFILRMLEASLKKHKVDATRYRWMHFDIAGAMEELESSGYSVPGGLNPRPFLGMCDGLPEYFAQAA